jgi:hypothetical protein
MASKVLPIKSVTGMENMSRQTENIILSGMGNGAHCPSLGQCGGVTAWQVTQHLVSSVRIGEREMSLGKR